ncbi:hypothetical protein A3E11_00360 [Candidatus Curtissbacteria bacterium RIFCSPHIGHO2_12_FULL_38_37]|nr:MAG: hypothetical protein A3E11_00360 [Candidatus Curtissbacteria bacterium RIFCSPHIGHO2_12_FULL_38_37]
MPDESVQVVTVSPSFRPVIASAFNQSSKPETESGWIPVAQLLKFVSNPVLENFSVLVRVACPAVEAVTLDEESNLVLSDQLVCPLPPDQSVCVQGEEAA